MKTTRDTLHNWFDIDCSVRTHKEMTTEEFDKLLQEFLKSMDWENVGTIKYSQMSDEEYNNV